MLKEMYPAYPIITTPAPGDKGLRMSLDTSRLRRLGVACAPARAALRAQCESLIRQRLVPPPGGPRL